jgi:peptidoglycan/LPS O-acetylase OafA/YrhL
MTMNKRRVLERVDEPLAEAYIPFQQVTPLAKETKEATGRRAKTPTPTAAETFVAILVVFFLMLLAGLALTGHLPAAFLGMLSFSLLVMATLLLMGNYMIKTGRLDKGTLIYFWIFALSVSLMIFYLTQKGVLPLLFGGQLSQVGLMEFEWLISNLVYIIIAVAIIGGIVLLFATPKKSE